MAKKALKKAPRLFPGLSHPNARAQRAFLVAYAKAGIVGRAAKAARVTSRTHQNWLEYEGEAGEQYRAAFAEAKELAADALEAEARRRAIHGLRRYKFTKTGEPIYFPDKHREDAEKRRPYYEHEYSDVLLLAMLKAHRPEQYREATQIDLNVNIADRLRAARQRLSAGEAPALAQVTDGQT